MLFLSFGFIIFFAEILLFDFDCAKLLILSLIEKFKLSFISCFVFLNNVSNLRYLSYISLLFLNSE